MGGRAGRDENHYNLQHCIRGWEISDFQTSSASPVPRCFKKVAWYHAPAIEPAISATNAVAPKTRDFPRRYFQLDLATNMCNYVAK